MASLPLFGGRSSIIQAFSMAGFFDKLGYVEPPAPGQSKLGLILGITIPLIVILGGLGLYLYCKKKEKQKPKPKQEQ